MSDERPVIDFFEISFLLWSLTLFLIMGLFASPWFLLLFAGVWWVFFYACRNCTLVAHRYG